MGRKALTLPDLVGRGVFDSGNWRHRRALDQSTEPLENARLEDLRQRALYFRLGRGDAKVKGAETLRRFAEAVNERD
jgi:hypothetical protein